MDCPTSSWNFHNYFYETLKMFSTENFFILLDLRPQDVMFWIATVMSGNVLSDIHRVLK